MADIQKAIATQLANIEKKTGKSIDALTALVVASGLKKHGEIRDMFKRDLGLGHGDANALAHKTLDPGARDAKPMASGDDVAAELDRLYAGPKAATSPRFQ